jgi:hypothetical protein
MRTIKQFSVSLVNRPGVLANICKALADEKINIAALTISDSADLGIMRFISDKPDLTKSILSRFDSPVTETEVLAVDMPNRPGALAGVLEKLNRAHININYAYVTAGTQDGKATVILKVQYPDKVMKVLKEPERNQKLASSIRRNF